MGFLKNLIKTGIDIGTLPVSIAKDVVTLGGALSEEPETYTKGKAKKILDDFNEIRDSLDDD